MDKKAVSSSGFSCSVCTLCRPLRCKALKSRRWQKDAPCQRLYLYSDLLLGCAFTVCRGNDRPAAIRSAQAHLFCAAVNEVRLCSPDELTVLAPGAVVTGLPLGKYIGCAGSGKDRFLIKKLHISRSFPGTGDLYGAVLIGSLLQGNALSAAADNAAEFVALSIQSTPAAQDTRFGVWFEPLLPRLCPVSVTE